MRVRLTVGRWSALGLLLVGCATASPPAPRPISQEERAHELAHALLRREVAGLDSAARTALLLERTRSDVFPDVAAAVDLLASARDDGLSSPPSALLLGGLLVEPDGSVRLWHHASREHAPLGAPWRRSIGPAGFAALESAVATVARSCPRAPRLDGGALFRVATSGGCGGWILSYQELTAPPWADLCALAGLGERPTLAERTALADRVEGEGLEAAELFVVETSGYLGPGFRRSYGISGGRWHLREAVAGRGLSESDGVLDPAQRAALQESLLRLLRADELPFPMVDGGALDVTLRREDRWVDFCTAPEAGPDGAPVLRLPR